ncbi:MAG: hypothetical protein WC575_01355 [Patescibacteria group bacterium]
MIQRDFTPTTSFKEIEEKLYNPNLTNTDEAIGLLHAVGQYFGVKKSYIEVEQAFNLLIEFADMSPGRSYKGSQLNCYNDSVAEKARSVLCACLDFSLLAQDKNPNIGKFVLNILNFFSSNENISHREQDKKHLKDFLYIVYYAVSRNRSINESRLTTYEAAILANLPEVSQIHQRIILPMILAEQDEHFIFTEEFLAIPVLEKYIHDQYKKDYGCGCDSITDAVLGKDGSPNNRMRGLVNVYLTLSVMEKRKRI